MPIQLKGARVPLGEGGLCPKEELVTVCGTGHGGERQRKCADTRFRKKKQNKKPNKGGKKRRPCMG
jgi:hypothetical protein